jgi:2-oxoisovalerate dehydrogenase E1 component beta subunit
VFAPSGVFGPAIAQPPATGARMTYHRAIRDALREEMDRDPFLFMIGEDIGVSNGAFKITEGFTARYDGIDWRDYWQSGRPFPQRRVIDAPIAEAGLCGLALGAVLEGLRAIVEFQYADFASDAFKMLVNYAATQTVRRVGPVPVVFRLPAGWAPNASMYHSVNPESWFASTPGLKIVAPVTAFDAKGLMKAAIRDGNPVLYLEYKAYYRTAPDKLPPELNLPVPEEDYVVPVGRARVVRPGADVSVITYGSQVIRALEAAHRLEREDGVSVEVVDLRTLVPYDTGCVRQSVEKTNRVLVTCEAPRTGCFGNTIVAEIARTCFESLDAPIELVAAADTPVPFSPALEAAHLPTTDKLVSALRGLLGY